MPISLVTWLALAHQALFPQASHHHQVGQIAIVLISDDGIILLELSVVTNTEQNFAAASSRKVARYGPLHSDLEHASLLVELVTIEVGCLGHFLPSTLFNLYVAFVIYKNAWLDQLFSNRLLELPFHAPIGSSMLVCQNCGTIQNF